MKPSRVGGGGSTGIYRDPHKGVNGGKILVIATSHFFFSQLALRAIPDRFVKKKTNPIPSPHEYIYIKALWPGLYTLNRIRNNYRIQISPLVLSNSPCPPCLWLRRRGVGGQ